MTANRLSMNSMCSKNPAPAPFLIAGGGLPGFNAYIARYVDDRVTIIVLSNVTNTPASQVGEGLADVVFEGSGFSGELKVTGRD